MKITKKNIQKDKNFQKYVENGTENHMKAPVLKKTASTIEKEFV